MTINLKPACLAAVHTDDFSPVASVGTFGNAILTIDIAILDGWVIGAKGAKSTLTSTIEFGWAVVAEEVFTSCAFAF